MIRRYSIGEMMLSILIVLAASWWSRQQCRLCSGWAVTPPLRAIAKGWYHEKNIVSSQLMSSEQSLRLMKIKKRKRNIGWKGDILYSNPSDSGGAGGQPQSKGMNENLSSEISSNFVNQAAPTRPISPGSGSSEVGGTTMRKPGESTMLESIPKLNIVILTGRVGADPQCRFFDNGNCVANMNLAVKRQYHPLERKARGIKYGDEETDWFRLEVWGREAEYCARAIKKGMRVGIKGSLHIDIWIDKEQRERRTPRLIVSSIEILETKAEIALRNGEKFNIQKDLNRKMEDFQTPPPHQIQQQIRHEKQQQGVHSMDWLDGAKPKGGGGSMDEKLTTTPSPSADIPSKGLEQEEKLPSFFDDL